MVVCRGGGLPKSWMRITMPWFRLQVFLLQNKSFDMLFDDDALRGFRPAVGHHHGYHDNRLRGPRKLREVIGFVTNEQLSCMR